MSILDESLKDKLDVVRANILAMPNVPYEGVTSSFENEDEKVTIYSLLPNLENAEIVEKTTKNRNDIFIINNGLIASITKKTLQELLNNIAILVSKISLGELDEITNLKVLPEDLENIVKTMNCLSIKKNENRVSLLYQKYCLALKGLRQIQAMHLDFKIRSEKLKR